MALAPESPWWLVRHGKLAEAERSARRLSSSGSEDHAPEQVANMVRVTKLEQEEAKATGESSWLELFKGTDLRRTEITCLAWIGKLLILPPVSLTHLRVLLLTAWISAERLWCHICRVHDVCIRAGWLPPITSIQSWSRCFSHSLSGKFCQLVRITQAILIY